jgi:antitoxin HicB
MAKKRKKYTVNDGKMELVLEQDEEGGYTVTCPQDPALITQAETIEEAFEMARDAAATLKAGRAKLARRTRTPEKRAV